MKRFVSLTGVLFLLFIASSVNAAVRTRTAEGVRTITIKSDGGSRESTRPRNRSTTVSYTLIGWNDLGMHCISPRFSQMAILPPYNNLMAQVIKKGDPPQVVTSGFTLQYSLINNTTVKGKTDFWTYVKDLFGLSPSPGIGLTGNGLSGTMQVVGDHFEATGIPALPYNDNMVWDPYQQAVITLKDPKGKVIASTTVVIPVSDELNCQKCHDAGGIAAPGINTGSVEGNILTLHDQREGTDLMASRPVLCASCHSDNALGLTGNPALPSLSEAMHTKHGSLGASAPACFDCHPGPKTQCNRSAIEGMGPVGTDPNCERCHGDLQEVAASVTQGRIPWVQEPTCAQCHGQQFSTGQDLYRNSRGHGGVYCSACHNSPHAWWPSTNALDNAQPIALQGSAGPIGSCQVCHTTSPGGDNPHTASGHPAGWRDSHGDYVERNGTSSCQTCHGADLRGGIGPSCYSCHGNTWSGGGGD
jgi:hypothetical protein